MEKLTTTIKELLKPFAGRLTLQELEDIEKSLWIAVKERDTFIIGEDEKDAAVYVDYTANSGHFRNELREDQRQRAEESR